MTDLEDKHPPKITRLTQVGQILLDQGLINSALLEEALEIQKQTGDRLGKILVARGYITTFHLHKAIADHYQLPFINLHDKPASKTIQDAADLENYIKHQAIPYQREGDVTILATPDPRPSLIAWAEKRFQGKYGFVITSPFDIYWHLDTHFQKTGCP